MIGSRLRQIVFLSIIALTFYVMLANVLLPRSLGLALDSYSLTIIGKYLCFAMLAVALDLVWGYCGILSLATRHSSPGWICHGDVPDASNRSTRYLR